MRVSSIFRVSLIALLSLALSEIGQSQTLPVGELQDEQLRLHMLLSDSLSQNLVNRPFHRSNYRAFAESASESSQQGWWNRPLRQTVIDLPAGFTFGLHPTSLQNTFNSRLPVGENNAAAWYGKGFNTELKGGFWIHNDYLTISIQPHLAWQQNRDFPEPRFLALDEEGNLIYMAEGIYLNQEIANTGERPLRIDMPFRFGPDAYWTADWGYSSVRLHYRQLEAGFSTEPLNWGGNVRYPLVMSNNAPGVPHLFIGTREPIHIPWFGAVQGRLIGGFPEESNYFIDEEFAGQDRFINSINLAWSPFITPTLTLGATRTFNVYFLDGFDASQFTRVFSTTSYRETRGTVERAMSNQLISFYAHLLLPEANAELYGEFLRNDHGQDSRDYFIQPHHNSGWSFGMQKIFYAPYADFYKVNAEFTNFTISLIDMARIQSYVYDHANVRHGHTNRGQVLGAAIGPGSNSQFVSIDAYRGDYKLGLFVQRVGENDTLHLKLNRTDLGETGDHFRHRINLHIGLNALYSAGPMTLHGGLVWTKAYNYGRFDYWDMDGVNVTNYDRNDLSNIQLQLGVTYGL